MNKAELKSLSVHFTMQEQTAENLHQSLDAILKRIGCTACGLVARFHLDLGNPVEAEFGRLGITEMIPGRR